MEWNVSLKNWKIKKTFSREKNTYRTIVETRRKIQIVRIF